MIVELFGPPASGKSTLGNALVAALHNSGIEVQLNASSRPLERTSTKDEQVSNARRWSRSIVAPFRRAAKMSSFANILVSRGMKTAVGENLLELLPPGNWLSRARLQRYLWLLHRSHVSGRSFRGISIVDQGYVTALCSLAVRARCLHSESLARGLEMVPQPDLLIYLDTPEDVLQARLSKRLGRQNAFERIFEQNSDATRRQMDMVRTVGNLVEEHRWPTVHVSWIDRSGLAKSVDKIITSMAAQREARAR